MSNKHLCPVCEKFEFQSDDSMMICKICGWQDDGVQYDDHDYKGGANELSVNEAKEFYKQGKALY